MIKSKVLFLCSGNSCRTQMAEAFLRDLAGDRFEIISAGADPTPLDPEAVAAMRELGIDIAGQSSKDVSRFLGQRFTFVITLCDREQERTCPIFPGGIWRHQWNFENPALTASPAEHRQIVRRVRDQLREHVLQFVSEHQ
jgi:arsenate reductase (thioredoxin)